MSSWFSTNIVQSGRLPLFCFFCAFVAGFGFIRLSVRLIRAQVRWWPGNVTPGDLHVHHMVFGVVFMLIGGVTPMVAPGGSLNWRAGAAALFGLGPPWSSTSSRSSCTCATCTGPATGGCRWTRCSSPSA
jgi:hypothetical protein